MQSDSTQPCGHPVSAVVSSDEGTAYCGECELDADTEKGHVDAHAAMAPDPVADTLCKWCGEPTSIADTVHYRCWKAEREAEPCGVCGSTNDEHDNRLHRAWFSGMADERAFIAAWLRSPVTWSGPVSDEEDSHREYMERALRFAADAIENGEHHA